MMVKHNEIICVINHFNMIVNAHTYKETHLYIISSRYDIQFSLQFLLYIFVFLFRINNKILFQEIYVK